MHATVSPPITDPELRDAHYELDAAIDHLICHGNTAPYVGKLLIQHFGNSNPSPRYVREVAHAFQHGRYELTLGSGGSVTFGDEK